MSFSVFFLTLWAVFPYQAMKQEEIERFIKPHVDANEREEVMDIINEEIRNGNEDWQSYFTYKKVEVHPDPEAAKRGRPI